MPKTPRSRPNLAGVMHVLGFIMFSLLVRPAFSDGRSMRPKLLFASLSDEVEPLEARGVIAYSGTSNTLEEAPRIIGGKPGVPFARTFIVAVLGHREKDSFE